MAAGRGFEGGGVWADGVELVADLALDAPALAASVYPTVSPPAESPLESLPLLFLPGPGRVVISQTDVGLRFASIAEAGGVVESLGEVPLSDAPPLLEPDAAARLGAYVGYHLRRGPTRARPPTPSSSGPTPTSSPRSRATGVEA